MDIGNNIDIVTSFKDTKYTIIVCVGYKQYLCIQFQCLKIIPYLYSLSKCVSRENLSFKLILILSYCKFANGNANILMQEKVKTSDSFSHDVIFC